MSKFFKIREIGESIGIAGYLANHKVLATYNQLMKCSSRIGHILLFSGTGIELPSLITYSHHFGVKLLKICESDVADIQNVIKHARMIAIPSDSPLCDIIDRKIDNLKTTDISIDLSKITLT